ncbi:thermonuclease family protein [Staphylococcus nepalensis]|uniref:thermonuclease family protein n=1 Tax=Staphylococcus nepalensis TaxID=214473 RepID=UPI000E682D29|nr:thermonuclease family protein [Staphylococcus nepalensis]RIO38810.1 DNA-binding protein [Staphylococcus nepalensis]
MKKLLFLLLASFLVLSACGDNEQSKSEDKKENQSSSKDAEKGENKEENKQKEITKKENSKESEDKTTLKSSNDEDKSETKNDQQKSEDKKENKPKPGTTDKIPVELASTVDGDTAKFIYEETKASFRFLLIDTPETKHPSVGKQPFGQEASDRTAELLNNAEKIEVEFDVGEKQDKYGRNLAYIYVDGDMLNNILVREGLAKVAYVYPPNTRYLTELENSQEQAKSEKIGIWSLNSAFEEQNNTQNQAKTENNSNSDPTSSNNFNDDTEDNTNSTTENTTTFPNCTALRQVYPEGVPQDHPAYESKHDRDKDGYACEVS